MSYTSRFKISTAEVPSELKPFMNGLLLSLERELKAIEKSAIDSNQIRTVVSAAGGGSGSSLVAGLQAGQSAVGTSPTTITLTTSVTSYIILYRCVNSLNENIGCDITSITSGSFVATALATATLHWGVFPTT